LAAVAAALLAILVLAALVGVLAEPLKTAHQVVAAAAVVAHLAPIHQTGRVAAAVGLAFMGKALQERAAQPGQSLPIFPVKVVQAERMVGLAQFRQVMAVFMVAVQLGAVLLIPEQSVRSVSFGPETQDNFQAQM
jgi:hypothetical protein